MAINERTSPMVTVREVARILNVHTNTVRRWSNQGILSAYRITSRGDRRFKRDDIGHFLNELNKHQGDAKKAALDNED